MPRFPSPGLVVRRAGPRRRRRLGLRILVLLALPGLAAHCGGRVRPVHVGRPPVILISVDTLRSDRLPAYGYTEIETPNIDRLAADGVLFERAYSHCPLTLPSHASILTGLLPPEHGVRDNRGYALPPATTTLADRLRQAGYRTAGVVSSMVLRRETGISRGFESYDDSMQEGRREGFRTFAQRPGAESIAIATRWLAGLSADGTPFLFLHLFEPHTPYAAPEPYATRHPRPYDAEVAYADALIGDLLDFLERSGMYDGALILFLSDHGEGLGDHGESEHGLFLYRESLQVPLIIKLPGRVLGGTRVATPAALTDIAPTVLDLLGLPAADLAGARLFGSTPAEPGRRIYSETLFTRHQYGWSELLSGIEGRFHYIRAPGAELYDLVADPQERDNLFPREPAPRTLTTWIDEVGSGNEATAETSREALERLAGLGYIGGFRGEEDWRSLPDPKDHVHEVEELWSLVGRIGATEDLRAEARVLQLTSTLKIRNESLYRTIASNLLRAGRARLAFEILRPYGRSTERETRLVLGRVLVELDRPAEARRFFTEVLAEDADDAEGHLGLGLLLLRDDRFAEAAAHLSRATALDPSLADGWNGLGVARARTGDLTGAIESWRRAVGIAPEMGDTWFNLAVTYRRLEDSTAAREALERYAALVPEPERERAAAMIRELGAPTGR